MADSQNDATDTREVSAATMEFSHPATVTVDSPFRLEIENIPVSAVDITASLADADGTEWTATDSYPVADGTLDLGNGPRSGNGNARGVAALLQQATPSDDQARYAPPRGDGEEITVTVDADGTKLGSTTVRRKFGDSGVSTREVDSNEFVGTVYYPPGEGQNPAVLALHGSGGQPAHATARLLASHGFVVLALHYFDWRGRHEILPRELVDVPLTFVEAAAGWLLDDSRVEGSRVGVWGASKGGEYALLAGARLDTVGPVVSVNGSGVVWQGFSQGQTGERSSWSAEEAVPYVPYTDDRSVWDETPPMELEPAYSASYREASQADIDRATIGVESIDGKVLLVSSGDDSMWDSVTLQGIAADRLDRHGCVYEHLVYEDAGHAINHPYMPTTNRTQSKQFVMGGTQTGYARAEREYWPKAVETFERLRA